MNSIDFFKKISTEINQHAEEITIVGNQVEENLFNSKKVPDEYLFAYIDVMGSVFSEGVNLKKLQQFSFQPADGINYTEHKFMAVYSGGKVDCEKFDIDVTRPHDDYCINYFLDSKKQIAKFYDLDLWKHRQPMIISGSQILSHWGQGVSVNPEKKDLYFMHNDVEAVANFYNLPIPFVQSIEDFCKDTSFMKVFGLTYNASTYQPLKLKLYYYPADPLMKSTVFDEVQN
jgi:hypothetical protein